MSDATRSKAAAKVLRQSNNEWSNKYFAIALGAIMILFAIHHWLSVRHFYYGSRKINPILARIQRTSHQFLSTSWMGMRTDRSLLYIIYWSINLILTLTNVDLTQVSYVAKRLGWISVANLVLLVFLALKNTPLAPLTATSYEKLRPLHKVAGYTCIFTSVLHGVVYLAAWSESGELASMGERKNYTGAIAGMAMVIIGCSTIKFFMRANYELFYMLHISLFILIMITVGLHRPKFSTSTVIIIIFTACLWVLDRLIRGARIVWNFFGNSAMITALPNEALRVRLKRCMRSRPGSHGFLWVPAIRWIESHPFTLVSSSPSEFVIRVYDGFTRDLYNAAQQAPGQTLRCSLDGPYGQVPNFRVFDKVVLIAGGSGASFTFAIALDLIQSTTNAVKSIDFIWVVRHQESLEWYIEEVKQLQAHAKVNLIVHVTRPAGSYGLSSSEFPGSPSEKGPVFREPTEAELSSANNTNDPEHGVLKQSKGGESLVSVVLPGRPSIGNIIDAIVESSSTAHDRVIVGACGPSELTSVTRDSVHKHLCNDGLSMTLYTEEFEW
ncbi:hypothetical protein ASPBRDRAFT_60260 [Aspergillus brasiliensis CBS 101740]|uniref:ferric-chelate reductase (NADPH) n=1 Tax=Aspergillus brasiliensis (strain CBS 101740 / IMI 381727 / IBT 21946) TaxID=767769 RepID=A0A1L9U2B5_ASPBC|nr:hypothetical protein ASPBRDRAFT_60260 [Aspergillus brasiliensis CBS 101740]